MSLLPLSACPKPVLANLRAVLTDIDDTLTHHGRMPAEAFAALHALRQSGLKVVPITGRPAGWCDMIARQWPVDGIVGENGAFYFRYDDGAKKMHRVYARSDGRQSRKAKLRDIARRVLAEFPGTAIASDQAYREIDVAVDFCEDVPPLPLETAERIAEFFAREGATAKVSSIHVNAWFGLHDKLTMSRRILAEALEIDSDFSAETVAFCGDSPNDQPMFAHFPNSFGVANVRRYAKLMKHLPRYVTNAEGGHGFAEFALAVLASRKGR